MSNNVTVVGDGGPCGTYALGIRASKPICEIALGTQKIYAKIDLKGQLVYLGAARAMKGACRLDQRLHRHATRTASEPPKPPKPPHPIREAVRPTFFEDDGWKHLLAGGKHLKWEIDWCLDHAHVVLQRITALQHPKELAIEHSLGIRLDGDLQTHIIKRGLGAQNWKDGFDHLLGVTADDVWWRLLSVRMEALACEQPAGAQVTKLVESYLRGRYCLKRICKLTRKRIQLAKFSGHRVVDELVVVLQEIAGQRPSKLERMKRNSREEKREGRRFGDHSALPVSASLGGLISHGRRVRPCHRDSRSPAGCGQAVSPGD